MRRRMNRRKRRRRWTDGVVGFSEISAGDGGCDLLIRMLPLAAIRGKVKSPFVRSFLYYVPYAVLGAMTFPAVFSATGSLTASAIGAAVALVLGWMGKSLLTVAAAACVAALAAGMLLP